MAMLLNKSGVFCLRIINQRTSRVLKSATGIHFRTRNLCSLNDLSKDIESINQEKTKNYKEIYRFPYIKLGLAINKFKWTQTLISAVALPACVALYVTGTLDSGTMISILFPGTVIICNLYFYGYLFTEAVGFMYLSEDESTLKISYLDYWGRRVDKEVPADDVMPLTDCPSVITDYVYRTIYIYSEENLKPKLFLRGGGQVTDVNRFVRVFGDFKSC